MPTVQPVTRFLEAVLLLRFVLAYQHSSLDPTAMYVQDCYAPMDAKLFALFAVAPDSSERRQRYLKLAKPVAVNYTNLPPSVRRAVLPLHGLSASLPACHPASLPGLLLPLHGLRVVYVKNTLIA
jgi:hypothetical protein